MKRKPIPSLRFCGCRNGYFLLASGPAACGLCRPDEAKRQKRKWQFLNVGL